MNCPARRSRWGAAARFGALAAVVAWPPMGVLTGAPRQADGGGDRVEVLMIGEIDRIDAEERSFRIRTARTEPEGADDPPRRPFQVGPISVAIDAGIARNGVSLGAGAGQPAPDSQRRQAPTGRLPQAVPTPDPESLNDLTTRVFTSEETRLHRDGMDVAFEALARGDRVTVRGVPRGNDIDAVDIALQAPDPARN